MRPIRTLIVDDSDDIRLLLRLMLQSDAAVEVCGEAVNGQEALDLAAQLSPDAIILDLTMPIMDGVTALPLLRELCPQTRVIVLTATLLPGVRELVLSLGACAVLAKSGGAGELIERLTSPCDQIERALPA